MSAFVWERSPSALADEVEAYVARVQRAISAVGEYIAPKIEAWAKENAPWVDRTGNARQGLTMLD